jgi:hypothetical protein
MATYGKRSPDMEDLELQIGSKNSQTPLNVNAATAKIMHIKIKNDNKLPVEVTIAGDTSSLITDENSISKTYGAIGGEQQPAPASTPIKKTSKISSNFTKGGSHRLEKARTVSFSGVSDDESLDTKGGRNQRFKKERTVSFSGVLPDDDDDEEVDLNTPPPESPSEGWRKIQGFVKGGSFLLDFQQIDDKKGLLKPKQNRTRGSVARQHMEEIRAGIEFSTFHCILAILFYLGISVACYKWIFQPGWSVTDCCYFAVSTFTTVGFGYVRSTYYY